MKVLITGASGFVGQTLVVALQGLGHDVLKSVRQSQPDGVFVGDIGPHTNWRDALHNCDAVIHLAARAHVMKDKLADPLAEYRRVNVDGTLALARQAALAGVERLIFVSSIKVNGESTEQGRAFTASDTPAPVDAYGVSKMEAEQGLWQVARETGMEVVVIRPPLVYGPGVKANFASMMRWLKRNVPLPLGAIQNKRSLVALDNLVDLILTCLTHPAARNQTFMVSDGEDVSTTELLRRTARAMGHPAYLLPLPVGLLKVAVGLMGKGDIAQRLCGSLQVDITQTRELLGWTPPLTLDEGLVKTVVKGDRAS